MYEYEGAGVDSGAMRQNVGQLRIKRFSSQSARQRGRADLPNLGFDSQQSSFWGAAWLSIHLVSAGNCSWCL